MKKICLILFLFLVNSITSLVIASSGNYLFDPNQINKEQAYVSTVGFNLLNSNGVENRAVFFLDNSNTVNAFSMNSSRQIVICRGMYTLLTSDDELAAVLAHEISHNVDSYNGIFRGIFSHFNYVLSPHKYEYKSDKRAIDFMVNAGYHPVAMIIVMNKIFPQYRYDWCSSHPLTSRRMMEVYEYIYKKYPEFLVNNPYKKNIYYQNFLLTSKENRAKFQEKIKNDSKKKVKYK